MSAPGSAGFAAVMVLLPGVAAMAGCATLPSAQAIFADRYAAEEKTAITPHEQQGGPERRSDGAGRRPDGIQSGGAPYIVNQATWEQLSALTPAQRREMAVAAVRQDGARVALRADAILGGSEDAGKGCRRIRARRGLPKVASGIALMLLGLVTVSGGGAGLANASNGGVVLQGIIIGVGVCHLIPGAVLTLSGATDGPEDGAGDMYPLGRPLAGTEACDVGGSR